MTESRLKFGAHQFLWKSHWTDDDLGILDTACRLGCTFFEVSLGNDVSFDRPRLGRHAAALGMELTVGPGNLWPMECDISDISTENRHRGLDWHRRIIAQAAELGAVAYCGATYGHPGRVCRRPPAAGELDRAAENLQVLAEYAASYSIYLVIEPMSRFRTHLINTAEQAMALLRRANHDNLRITLDTYHMITEERDYAAAIRRVLPLLWSLHACENDRGVPGGGLVPWSHVFAALAAHHGTIRLMLETYNTGPGGLGFSRGVFQDVCPDAESFCRRGLEFLRSQMVQCDATPGCYER